MLPQAGSNYMTNGFRNNPKDVESHCESKEIGAKNKKNPRAGILYDATRQE